MSNIPTELKYSQTHEWIEIAHDGTAVVGVTDHAQALLGDIVFVETPEVGAEVSKEDPCAVVESVKAASDIYAIVSGEIIEGNSELEEIPQLINSNPYIDGWIYKIKIADESELDGLMDADAYQEFIADSEE